MKKAPHMLSASSPSTLGMRGPASALSPAPTLPPGAQHLPPAKQIQMALDHKIHLSDRIRDVDRFLGHALGGTTPHMMPPHAAHASSPASSSSTCAKDLEPVLPMLVRDIFSGSAASAPTSHYGAGLEGAGAGVGSPSLGSKYRGWNLKGD